MDASWTLMLFNPENAPARNQPYTAYRGFCPIFQSIGQPLLQGRDFLESDTADALVCVVSSRMAQRITDSAGDESTAAMEIVGVAGDMKAIADPRR